MTLFFIPVLYSLFNNWHDRKKQQVAVTETEPVSPPDTGRLPLPEET
jgi:hypothetical protein